MNRVVLKARGARVPLRGARWRHRLIVLVAALFFAGIVSFLQLMPGADNLSKENQSAAATKIYTAALYNLRPTSVLQLDGDFGSGLKATLSIGRPSATTRTNLAALGFDLPEVKGARARWIGVPPKDGRIEVKIANERQSPEAGIMLQATGSEHVPELNIRAVETALTVDIAIASQSGQPAGTAELSFGGKDFNDSSLGFVPLEFEVPAGEWLNLTFDNEAALAASSFSLGERLDTGGTGSVLPIGRVEVGRLAPDTTNPRLTDVEWRVCAAPAGKLLFTRLSPAATDCRLAADPKTQNDNLYATDIQVAPNSVNLEVEGSGFILKDGRQQPAEILKALQANPLIAAAITAAAAALIRSLWKLWVGRNL